MKFLPSLGGRRPEVKAAPDRRYSASSRYVSNGVPLSPTFGDADLDRLVTDAWGRVIWVYRAVDARAKNASRLNVKVMDGRGDDAKQIEDHPVSGLLNRRANAYESGTAFRYRLHTLLDLSIKGVPVEVQENDRGDLVAVHILNPMWVNPVPDPDRFLAGFQMVLPGGETFGPNELPVYKRGEGGGVIWVRRPHPTDPYSSQTWLSAARMSVDLDYYARLFNRNFLMNDGRPGGLLMVKSEDGIDPADAAALQRRVSGGPGVAGKVSIMEADHLEYVDLSQTARDAQYVEGRAMTQREILVAAGTPLSVIGDASGRTFDNADAEFESFWRTEMVPECDLVGSFYEELTDGGATDDSQVITYNYESIEVLNRDKRAVEARLQAEWSAGLISVDEYRAGTGKDPLDLPGTRVLWLVSGKAPVGTDQDVRAILQQGQTPVDPTTAPPVDPATGAPALPPAGGGPLAIEGPNAVIDGEVVDPLNEALYAQAKARPGPSDTLVQRRREQHAALINLHEEAVSRELAGLLRRQEQVILSRLTGAKARRHTRHWEGASTGHEVKALDDVYVVDRGRWVEELVRALADVVAAAFTAGGSAALAQLGSREEFAPGDTAAVVVAATIRSIADGFDARAGTLQDTIAAAEAAGDPLDRIAEQVREAYVSAPPWADATSRQVVGAMNQASLIGAVQAGAAVKRWLATDDERTRPTHQAAEGQVVPIGGDFTVGAARLSAPGDPAGPLAETINCRCTMLYQLDAATTTDTTLDADLAGLAAFDGDAGWKARGFSAVDVTFNPNLHPRDGRGRFLDVPGVTLRDGTIGRALAAVGDTVTVETGDGRTLSVAADTLGDAAKPSQVLPPAGHVGSRRTGDAVIARGMIPTVGDLIKSGYEPEAAAAEYKRQYETVRKRIRRDRLKNDAERAERLKVARPPSGLVDASGFVQMNPTGDAGAKWTVAEWNQIRNTGFNVSVAWTDPDGTLKFVIAARPGQVFDNGDGSADIDLEAHVDHLNPWVDDNGEGYGHLTVRSDQIIGVWGPPPLAEQMLGMKDQVARARAGLTPEVLADLDAPRDSKPKVLYSLPFSAQAALTSTGGKASPGHVPDPRREGAMWQNAAAMLDDGETIPVVGLNVQGRVVYGTATKVDGMPYLVEHAGDPLQPMPNSARLTLMSMQSAWSQVSAGVLPELARYQEGFAYLTGPNPADAEHAARTGMANFTSAATGGDGTTTYWNSIPSRNVTAHEFGHNVDAKAAHLGVPADWVSSSGVRPSPPESAHPGTPVAGKHTRWSHAKMTDKTRSFAFLNEMGGSTRYLKEVDPHHQVIFGGDGPTRYGETNRKEDFAESVRLYLTDRRYDRLATARDPNTLTAVDVRFADVFPERATFLDLVFGNPPIEHPTPWETAMAATPRLVSRTLKPVTPPAAGGPFAAYSRTRSTT